MTAELLLDLGSMATTAKALMDAVKAIGTSSGREAKKAQSDALDHAISLQTHIIDLQSRASALEAEKARLTTKNQRTSSLRERCDASYRRLARTRKGSLNGRSTKEQWWDNRR